MEEPTNNQDSNEIEELKTKRDEYLNNWKRSAADFINYKKGEIERAGMLVQYSKEGIIHGLLPIIDTIYLASAAFGKEAFVPIQKQIEEFLKKEGIEEISAVGQPFNPETMEIVEETQEGTSGIVAEELQKGYMTNGKVIRPTKVKVTK